MEGLLRPNMQETIKHKNYMPLFKDLLKAKQNEITRGYQYLDYEHDLFAPWGINWDWIPRMIDPFIFLQFTLANPEHVHTGKLRDKIIAFWKENIRDNQDPEDVEKMKKYCGELHGDYIAWIVQDRINDYNEEAKKNNGTCENREAIEDSSGKQNMAVWQR